MLRIRKYNVAVPSNTATVEKKRGVGQRLRADKYTLKMLHNKHGVDVTDHAVIRLLGDAFL